MYFAAHVAENSGAGNVNSLLAGVVAGLTERGVRNPIKGEFGQHLPRLRKLIRGIKRLSKKGGPSSSH